MCLNSRIRQLDLDPLYLGSLIYKFRLLRSTTEINLKPTTTKTKRVYFWNGLKTTRWHNIWLLMLILFSLIHLLGDLVKKLVQYTQPAVMTLLYFYCDSQNHCFSILEGMRFWVNLNREKLWQRCQSIPTVSNGFLVWMDQ